VSKILCCAWLALTATVAAAEPPPSLVLHGASVLDPAGDRWIEGKDVVIEAGRIAASAPAAAQRLELSGLHLLPGLIDLHTHLLLHPYDETPWDDQVLHESLELRTIRAVTAARRTLDSGFTTVRELGTEGAGWADVALRDAIESGLIPGPRVFAATRAIVATASYGPAGFDPRWDVPQGAQEASGVAEIRRVVREQVSQGADWVKVYADYRRGRGAPSTPTFSQEELDALVDEARSAGRPVAAHATTDEGIRRAVRAGVRTIEHGTGVSAETLRSMRERGVVLCPTLQATYAVARYAGWNGADPEPESIRASRAFFRRALDSGVTIACGSDAGVFAHGQNVQEIERMVAYGMASDAALRAATLVAAKVLGQDERLGRIAVGYAADLIAVRGDPLRDPATLREPVVVIRNGVVVRDGRK
jgi:imidazolonepropionase-like amidohydrolase